MQYWHWLVAVSVLGLASAGVSKTIEVNDYQETRREWCVRQFTERFYPPVRNVGVRERLKREAARWQQGASAIGDRYINPDLARLRLGGYPPTHLWGGPADDLNAYLLQPFMGKPVEITSHVIHHRRREFLPHDKTYTGRLVRAQMTGAGRAFVEYQLETERGETVLVPFEDPADRSAATGPRSYSDFLHGHSLRELRPERFDPFRRYQGHWCYARLHRIQGGKRYTSPLYAGQVVEQEGNALTLQMGANHYRFRALPAEEGYLQVGYLPSDEVPLPPLSTNWRMVFESPQEWIGHALTFERIPSRGTPGGSRYRGEVLAASGAGEQYRLDLQLNPHLQSNVSVPLTTWQVVPSTETYRKHLPHTTDTSRQRKFLGQLVDAVLVEVSLIPSAGRLRDMRDQREIDSVRGVVVAEDDESLTLQSLNGQRVRLDLFLVHQELARRTGDYTLSSFIEVRPHEGWLPR